MESEDPFMHKAATADRRTMTATPDDWRRMGQERYLLGAPLTLKRYQALSAEWEHEHCEFCFSTFIDPNHSPQAAKPLSSEPGKGTYAGYTNVDAPDRPAGKWWICKQCFEDFADEFGWSVVAGDPDAWPYHGPEPKHRPTVAEYDESRWVDGPNGRLLKRPE